MPAEISLENPAIFRPIENCAPGFQLADAIRRFLRVELGHPPIVDILSAAHRIGEVDLPAVPIVDVRERRRDPAFGHYGMRLAEQTFANHPDGNAGCRCFNRGPQSRAAGADDENVVLESFVVRHGGLSD
jgi:hypothetical protein